MTSCVKFFRARHSIVARQVCVGADGVPEDVTEEWLCHKWLALCEGYKPEKIFNMDETDLFFNVTSDKIVKFSDEHWKGRKLSKAKITINSKTGFQQ